MPPFTWTDWHVRRARALTAVAGDPPFRWPLHASRCLPASVPPPRTDCAYAFRMPPHSPLGSGYGNDTSFPWNPPLPCLPGPWVHTALYSLDGLGALESVYGEVLIKKCSSLSSTSGLKSLTYVGEHVLNHCVSAALPRMSDRCGSTPL